MAGLGSIGMIKIAAVTLTGLLVVGGGGAVYLGGLPDMSFAPMPSSPAIPDVAAVPAVVSPQHDPASQPAHTPPPESAVTGFDVVRVDPGGAAVIAGRGVPGQPMALTLDGAPVTQVEADGSGQFVGFVDLPLSSEPRLLELRWTGADGVDHISAESVILAPAAPALPPVVPPTKDVAPATTADVGPEVSPEVASETPPQAADAAVAAGEAGVGDAGPEAAPQILRAGSGGVAPLVARALPQTEQVAIDSIAYGRRDAVIVQGRSGSAGVVRLTLDGKPVGPAKVLERPGPWRVDLLDVVPGRYAMSAQLSAPSGTVLSRSDTPFLRAEPGEVPTYTGVDVVTVQPGFTLWRIARDRYGEGTEYVQVFEANRSQIRNPDLIYPGQVLALPD